MLVYHPTSYPVIPHYIPHPRWFPRKVHHETLRIDTSATQSPEAPSVSPAANSPGQFDFDFFTASVCSVIQCSFSRWTSQREKTAGIRSSRVRDLVEPQMAAVT
jgi:hypothetical protein